MKKIYQQSLSTEMLAKNCQKSQGKSIGTFGALKRLKSRNGSF